VPEQIDLVGNVAHWFAVGRAFSVAAVVPMAMLGVRWYGVAKTPPTGAELNTAILAAAVGLMMGQLLARYAQGVADDLTRVWTHGELVPGTVARHLRRFTPSVQDGLRFSRRYAEVVYRKGKGVGRVYVDIQDDDARHRLQEGLNVQVLIDRDSGVAEVPLEYGLFLMEEDAPPSATQGQPWAAPASRPAAH